MDELTVGQVIMSLRSIKKTTQDKRKLDSLNAACNVLESHYDWDMPVNQAIDWTHWR